MRTEVRTFDNEEIERLLDKETNYRKFTAGSADRWLTEMLAGRWVDAHPVPIILSWNGKRLIDGQHRLAAALHYNKQTKKRIRFNVCYTQNEDAVMLTTDVGRARKIGDHLRHIGCHNVSTIGSLLGIEAKVQKLGKMNALMFDGSAGSTGSVSQLADIFDSHRGRIEKVATQCQGASKTACFGAAGLIAAVGWQLQKCGRDAFDIFIEKLGNGLNMTSGDPIAALRRTLQQRASRNAENRRTIERRCVTAALMVKGWNSWIRGESVEKIRWGKVRAGEEEFPQPLKASKILEGIA